MRVLFIVLLSNYRITIKLHKLIQITKVAPSYSFWLLNQKDILRNLCHFTQNQIIFFIYFCRLLISQHLKYLLLSDQSSLITLTKFVLPFLPGSYCQLQKTRHLMSPNNFHRVNAALSDPGRISHLSYSVLLDTMLGYRTNCAFCSMCLAMAYLIHGHICHI